MVVMVVQSAAGPLGHGEQVCVSLSTPPHALRAHGVSIQLLFMVARALFRVAPVGVLLVSNRHTL